MTTSLFNNVLINILCYVVFQEIISTTKKIRASYHFQSEYQIKIPNTFQVLMDEVCFERCISICVTNFIFN